MHSGTSIGGPTDRLPSTQWTDLLRLVEKRDPGHRERLDRPLRVRSSLPRFAAKRQFRWKIAFALFFLARHVA